MYQKAVTLSELVWSTEERPRVCGRQRNRENHPAESDIQYWKRTVAIPFLDVICSELKSRFSKEKRAHYEPCALITRLSPPSPKKPQWKLVKYFMRSGAIWCNFHHLSKVNCFAGWTTASDSGSSGVGLWINLGVLTISETRRRHLLPKREGTSKSSRHSAYGEHVGGKVIFLYSEDPYLASQHNHHRTTLRFRCHRHACQYSYHR